MYLRLAVVCVLAALVARAQGMKPNFTGTWTCVSPGRQTEFDHIKHAEPMIDMKEQMGRRADVIYGETCRTDGKTLEYRFGNTRTECTGHGEGERLILEMKRIDSRGEQTTHVELSLTDDETTMIKRIAQRSASGKTDDQTFRFRLDN